MFDVIEDKPESRWAWAYCLVHRDQDRERRLAYFEDETLARTVARVLNERARAAVRDRNEDSVEEA